MFLLKSDGFLILTTKQLLLGTASSGLEDTKGALKKPK
jgi:hypothetical protein